MGELKLPSTELETLHSLPRSSFAPEHHPLVSKDAQARDADSQTQGQAPAAHVAGVEKSIA